MWGYRNRLDRDLARWRSAGFITADAERAIRADVKAQGSGVGLPQVLAILAAVLIGFAVMSFVAANWQDMPRPARLAMLLTALWAAYGLADQLFARNLLPFGHAAVLLGCGIFGASIMIVSQMYHMDGNAPDAVLLWALGTLAAGLAARSNPALAFALLLFSIWGFWESMQRDEVFWLYLAAWAVMAAAFFWQRWGAGIHLSGMTLSGFILVACIGFWHAQSGYELLVAAGTVMGSAAVVGLALQPRFEAIWRAGILYAAVLIFIGLWLLQFTRSPEILPFILLAGAALGLTLVAIWWGLAAPDRSMLWLGYAGFSIEILGIYSKTIGTLMGSSLFFLTAGLMVAGLAYFAYRLHARGERLETSP